MSNIIFVSYYFSDELIGGAELTSDAIITSCEKEVERIKSNMVDNSFIEDNLDKKWIFGNFINLKQNSIIKIIKSKIDYDVLEYDFKFCEMRSPEKHALASGGCDCNSRFNGKLVSLFFSKSRKIWFMSEKQREKYFSSFRFLKDNKTEVLSSVFKDDNLLKMRNIDKNKNNKFVILNSPSWIKATNNCIKYAIENKLNYDLVSNLSHDEMLVKLASSMGLIFLPSGGDTCPRITIEAKLLDCELRLNDNVMHKDEAWFSGDVEATLSYLKNNKKRFWDCVNEG